MTITIKPITVPLPLDDYADGLEIRFDGGPARQVRMWVNPPRDLLIEHDAVAKSGARDQIAELYARLWSASPDAATHWTADEIGQLMAADTDPGLWPWLQARSVDAITAHRERARKN